VKILDALLSGDRLLGTLSRAGVRPGPLTSNGQPQSVPNAAITLDVPQAVHILLQLTPQRPFHNVVPFQQGRQTAEFIVRQLACLAVRINTRLVAKLS